MSVRRPPWSVLGLDPGANAGAIRKAYAAQLKAIDPDSDPAAFAQLREAREAALRLARRIQPPVETDTVPKLADEAAPAGTRPYAAPDFNADSATGDPALTISLSHENTAWLTVPGATFSTAGPVPAKPSIADPFFAVVIPHDGAKPAPTIGSLPPPDKRLHALLFGDQAEVALDELGLVTAQECMHRVLQDATQADITRHDAIEDWLADILAETWPRSAPLLAPAAQSFGWDAEAGQITERPAIAFLNARRRGYRFQDAVLEPKHVYHKAWIELQRPGPRNFLSRFRANGVDVARLLTGIRRNFPEVEHHLDPERVASWEAAPRFRVGLRRGWWLIVVVSFFVRLAISLSQPNPVVAPNTPSVASVADQAEDARAADAAVVAAFGAGHTRSWLDQRQPELAQVIASNTWLQRHAGNSDAKAGQVAIDLVRQRLFEAGRNVDGPLLDRIMQLRLAMMQAAQHAGHSACRSFQQTSLLDPTVKPLSEALRHREQALLVELADRRMLGAIEHPSPRTAIIPGKLVNLVIDATHLSAERVRAAMRHDGAEADSCAVNVALLGATLNYKGQERTAILKTL